MMDEDIIEFTKKLEFVSGGFPRAIPTNYTGCPFCQDSKGGDGVEFRKDWFICKKCKKVWWILPDKIPNHPDYRMYAEQEYKIIDDKNQNEATDEWI